MWFKDDNTPYRTEQPKYWRVTQDGIAPVTWIDGEVYASLAEAIRAGTPTRLPSSIASRWQPRICVM